MSRFARAWMQPIPFALLVALVLVLARVLEYEGDIHPDLWPVLASSLAVHTSHLPHFGILFAHPL